MRLLAVDPGERYVGYVIMHGWVVVEVGVLEPDVAVRNFWVDIETSMFDQVILEQWRNYGEEVTWSECTTVEVIGAVKHMCKRHKVPCAVQPALIKRPGRARMRAHGFEMPGMLHIPAKDRGHAEDATVHGYWWRFEQAFPTPGGLADCHADTHTGPLARVSNCMLG